MAPNNAWKGYLKLSLVTCPVAMTPVITESEKVRFHILNRETGSRVKSQYVDEQTGEPLEEGALAKGYPTGENTSVVLSDDELQSVKLESVRTIDIEKFVPADSIDWLWYDRSYFLVPDGAVGEEAFAVIREAMSATQTVGISRLIFYGRERAVMLKPRDKGIILWTMRFADEVRSADAYFENIPAAKPDKASVDHLAAVVAKQKLTWRASLMHDPIQEGLLKLIAQKKKQIGRSKPAAKKQTTAKAARSNVVDITEALRQSLKDAKAKPKRGA